MKITQFYQTNNYTVFCEHMKVMLQINIKITKKKNIKKYRKSYPFYSKSGMTHNESHDKPVLTICYSCMFVCYLFPTFIFSDFIFRVIHVVVSQ